MTHHIPHMDCKLVVFDQTGTVAFSAVGPCIHTQRATLREVWSWYETALDIASLPETERS